MHRIKELKLKRYYCTTSQFNFQLTCFISNFVPRFTQSKVSSIRIFSLSEILVEKLTLYLQREYHLKVRLRKFNPQSTNLVMETLREITNNFAATSIINPFRKSTRLQKTLSVQHGAASSQIPQDPAFNRAVLGTGYIRPSNTLGVVTHASKTGNPCKREYDVDTLLQPKPTQGRLPVEPKYKMALEDSAEETELDRQIRNNQLKCQWELKCLKVTEAAVLCGERPWSLCDQKCVSLLYLIIGTEWRRLLTQNFPIITSTISLPSNFGR